MKYLQASLIRQRMLKELKTISILEAIMQRCDSDELENLFTLHLVLKEERELLRHVS